jgi:NADPH-dependent glutamate synthase beta subunit-like oxidoreductase
MSIERIDLQLCTGCGTCVNSCPCDVIRVDALVGDREEFPPCRLGCPAGVNIRAYISLLKEDRVEEAINILREDLPFAAITGRVCPHFCESECARKDVDEAMNIRSLERFVGDHWLKEKAQPVRKLYVAKVAIVGSGPAGLAAAYELAKMGYPITVFEAMPVLGGMLRLGVPEYRLPRDVLDAQINHIRDMGVEFKTNIAIGKDMTLKDLKSEGYQAVFLAIGAQLSTKLEIKGTELDGVLWGLDFLKDVNLKRQVNVKGKVLVIGGGNVAIDVALVARRLGAKEVRLACLESAEEMPAHKNGIAQAIDEGVDINVSWGPKRILGSNGKVTGIELVRCVKVFDRGGVFNPSFDEQTTKTIEADMVILAIGQSADLSLVPQGVATQNGTIQVDPVTLQTSQPMLFAGGDVVLGPQSTVQAISSGRKAAVSIDRYLRGEDLKAGRDEKPRRVRRIPKEGIEKRARQVTPLLPVEQRRKNFKEVQGGFTWEALRQEAQRCMTCGGQAIIKYVDDCMCCDSCEYDCPVDAIYVSPEKYAPLMVSFR